MLPTIQFTRQGRVGHRDVLSIPLFLVLPLQVAGL